MSKVRTLSHEEWEHNRDHDRNLRLQALYALAFEKPMTERGARLLETATTIRPVKSRQVAAGLLALASVI